MGQHVFSAFLLIRGFSIWRVWQDAMHTLDLGVYQILVPSCIWELTQTSDFWKAPTRAARMLLAYRHYKAWCIKHKIQGTCRKFEPNTFKKKKSKVVQWSQRAAKAAHMRPLVFWLRDVCQELQRNEHEQVRAALFNAAVFFETTCSREGRFLSDGAVKDVEIATEEMLACYKYLSAEAGNSGLWHMLPKAHMFTHMGFDSAKKANPRRVHCFSDEDLVGKMKRILERCHGSVAHTRAVFRYALWATLRWWIVLHNLRDIPLS